MTSLPIVDETDLEPVELGQQTEPDGLDHDVRDNGWNEAFSYQYKHCILQILHKIEHISIKLRVITINYT